MEKYIYIIGIPNTGKDYTYAVSIDDTALDYYTYQQIERIITGTNHVTVCAPEHYDGPIDEHINFSAKVLGDNVVTMISKEDNDND